MSDWRERVQSLADVVDPLQLGRLQPPSDFSGHESAVLIAFSEGERGPELLLIERAHDGYVHSGQPAFPGGRMEADDDSLVTTALREAQEETGLDPSCVRVLAVLPRLHLSVSGHAVTPVVVEWHTPCATGVRDAREVAAVVKVPIEDLVNPENRVMYPHPSGGRGPAFLVAGLVVWGFTGGVIAGLLRALDWEIPWDEQRVFDPDAA